MRVSTNMIYDKGLQQMQAQSAELLRSQQQVSSGRRILTPADDPIAAARALEVRQSQSANSQFLANQAAADDRLRTTENRLTGVGDIMQYMRERAVQAGGAALGSEDLSYIATDLRAQFEALLGLANSRDAQGDYVFAGFQTNRQPYVGSFGDYVYQGDDNSIGVQVSASRTMPVGFTGSDVFGSARLPDPGVQARSVPAEGTISSFSVSLSTDSIQPPAGSSYTIRYDAVSGDYSVTRRDDDGTETDLGPATFDALAQTLSFDGGVVFDVSGMAEDGDALQVFVGASGITVANGSGQTVAGFDLALSAGSAQPDPGVRYIVAYDDANGDFLVTRREADGVTETALGAATYDAVAGTLTFDGLEFDIGGAARAGDVVQLIIGELDITVDASGVGGSATSPILAAASPTPDAGITYVLTWDDVAGDYDVIRREADGTETSVGVANYDAIGETITMDGGIVFDLAGTPQAGDVLEISIADLNVFISSAGTTTAPGEPLGLALAADSAEPDAGVRYIVGYSIGEDGAGGYSVIRRQPGVDDQNVDNLFFDADAGTLSFDNLDGDSVVFDVTGAPRDGDQAEVFVASRDIFANMALFIDALDRPGPTQMADGPVAFALDTLDMGLESVMRVRAQIGSQLVEIENLGKVGSDQDLQYASEISRLEDLDYAEAISRLSRQQVFLEAAQQSYLRVTGLSLFNFLS